MINFFIEIFSYSFFTNAFIASILIAIVCGFIGTYIVSRKIVLISGGITHASFGGIGIAHFLGFSPILGALFFALLSALGIEKLSNKKTSVNTSIAILWSLGMAIGILFIYLTPGYAPNLMTYLFGNILMINPIDTYLLAVLAIVVVVVFILLFNNILIVTFDQDYAKTNNYPVKTIKTLMMILVSISIVFSIKVIGIILIIALLSIPQNIMMLFTTNFKRIILGSIIIGIITCISGLFIAYSMNIPTGTAIVIILSFLYFICRIFKK